MQLETLSQRYEILLPRVLVCGPYTKTDLYRVLVVKIQVETQGRDQVIIRRDPSNTDTFRLLLDNLTFREYLEFERQIRIQTQNDGFRLPPAEYGRDMLLDTDITMADFLTAYKKAFRLLESDLWVSSKKKKSTTA